MYVFGRLTSQHCDVTIQSSVGMSSFMSYVRFVVYSPSGFVILWVFCHIFKYLWFDNEYLWTSL